MAFGLDILCSRSRLIHWGGSNKVSLNACQRLSSAKYYTEVCNLAAGKAYAEEEKLRLPKVASSRAESLNRQDRQTHCLSIVCYPSTPRFTADFLMSSNMRQSLQYNILFHHQTQRTIKRFSGLTWAQHEGVRFFVC